MKSKIRKAVFPVAGLGTRFLPATKAMPKELLPIIDKPLIQYAAEEAIAAGLDTLIFVTGRNKRAIEDHFDSNNELESCCLMNAPGCLVRVPRKGRRSTKQMEHTHITYYTESCLVLFSIFAGFSAPLRFVPRSL